MTIRRRIASLYDRLFPSGYWDRRYSAGGDSGAGSVGRSREWKWGLIEKYAGRVDDVVDVGCGDLRFWDGRDCSRYVGLDRSRVVLERDSKARPRWEFHTWPRGDDDSDGALSPIRWTAKVVICMDVLFHIMDDQTYLHVVDSIGKASLNWAFVHTWATNPLKHGDRDYYQRFRDFDPSPIGMPLIATEPNPHSPHNAMFVFHREEAPLKQGNVPPS